MTLANGLRVNLIHDPDASRAAALIQLSAGSHDGPPEWPGLAHLLEHVLFAGSKGYQNEQRLMAWGPANGARLNATTRAHHTAWFFDCAPERLTQGLLRLVDMLASPLLTQESVRQETAVIDAEFKMLTHHADTLCEAALSQAFISPSRLHDFHVGNLAAFGQDSAALHQALLDYHQHFFRAENLEMWLQGPQSVATLSGLAEEMGTAFASSAGMKQPDAPSLTLTPQRHYGLHIATAERLQLSAVVTNAHHDMLPVLQELLTDSAAGSLLATLRNPGLAETVSLLEPYRSPKQSAMTVQFELCDAGVTSAVKDLFSACGSDPAFSTFADKAAIIPAMVEALFHHWVQQLASLNGRVLNHYASLARRRFSQLTSLDQLRARAFGFVPPAISFPLAERWPLLLAALKPEKLTALWVSDNVVASPVQIQGFSLHSAALDSASGSGRRWPPRCRYSGPDMAFYADGEMPASPALPAQKAALRHFPASCQPRLLLNPTGVISRSTAALIEAALLPVAGQCLHLGGELSFTQQQGIWLLQLTAPPALLPAMLSATIDALNALSPSVIRQGERRYRSARQAQASDIAIRVLLAHLPELTGETRKDRAACGEASKGQPDPAGQATSQGAPPQASAAVQQVKVPESVYRLLSTSWQAALYGGDRVLQDAVSRLLSHWPGAGIVQPQPVHCTSAARLSEAVTVLHDPALQISASAKGDALDTLQKPPPPALVETVSEDAAVLLFCPLVERTATCLAAWQLLASLYEPEFFQRLRVEQNIGYVVSCRFHQCAGEAGILFALQSPALSRDELRAHIGDFIATMPVFIASIADVTFNKKLTTLFNAPPKTAEQYLDHWQQQQLNIPALSPSRLRKLSAKEIRQYNLRFATEKGRWQWLINVKKSVSSGNK